VSKSRRRSDKDACDHGFSKREDCLAAQLEKYPTSFPDVTQIKSTKREAPFMVKIERIYKDGAFAVCSGLFVDLDLDIQGDEDNLYVLTNAHCFSEVMSLALVVGFGEKDRFGRSGGKTVKVLV